MDRHTREATLRTMEHYLPGLVSGLNQAGRVKIKAGVRSMDIFLREGRNPSTGSTFNFFEFRWSGKKEKYQKLRCFLGNRFVPGISDSLRQNLRYVLEPLGVELVWSGMDMAAVGFFDDIIQKIKKCDFCIFDNRLTDEKPNVYIEVGITYALEKPFILANFKGNRLPVPSDLTHILNIPYTHYKDLCTTLYCHLPIFLRDVGLRKTSSSRSAN